MDFDALTAAARKVIEKAKARGVRMVTAESCTGGLIASALTAVAGSSAVVDRGFVTYSNESKVEMLDVSTATLAAHGAVSREVASAMANGALAKSMAHIAVAVTGIAGPEGGTPQKPVGTVWLSVIDDLRFDGIRFEETVLLQLGNVGRDEVRAQTVLAALSKIEERLG